ncbi:host attachment protein [Hahella aquimaris]|uniref:host attachment protein n=1 Tax=Hahella sp. HNIBRBA332 TaxID=3015983 RepID=UPI00273C54AE|nr:host attachment protein [Hahella sp. HNIBRBA332]WLQ15808.1 host attachment protein [Hahella sp. HNIBRBA332]
MTTWVLAADTTHARLFSCDTPKGALQELETLTHPINRLMEQEIVSDRNGGMMNGSGNHSYGEADRKKHEEVERFAKRVNERLNEGLNKKQYDKLYILSEPTFLGVLRRQMNANVRHCVAAEVDKNLTVHPIKDIRGHLPDYL